MSYHTWSRRGPESVTVPPRFSKDRDHLFPAGQWLQGMMGAVGGNVGPDGGAPRFHDNHVLSQHTVGLPVRVLSREMIRLCLEQAARKEGGRVSGEGQRGEVHSWAVRAAGRTWEVHPGEISDTGVRGKDAESTEVLC